MELKKNFYIESKYADWCFERGEHDFYLAWIIGKEVLSVEHIPSNWPALTIITTPVGEFKRAVLKRLKEIGYKKSESKW